MNTLKKVRKAPSNKTMGIEIEGLVLEDATDLGEWLGFFYRGYDMSIRTIGRYEAVEFVSQPLTYDWLTKETRKLFKRIEGNWVSNDSCGIHVHVSKKWFSDKKAKEVYTLLNDLTEDDIKHIFGRYLSRWTQEIFGQRNCTVNITNKFTNEFRVFASGNTVEWALYCLACTKYMVEHAHHLTADGLRAFRDCYSFSSTK